MAIGTTKRSPYPVDMIKPAAADEARPVEVHRVLQLTPRTGSPESVGDVRVVVRATVDDAAERASLRAGLLAKPASTSPKFFYDPQGSALFGAICELDEYYPTRTEAAIFSRYRVDIAAALPGGAQWVDLGCGDGMKARPWLEPAGAERYIGVDIAEPWLRTALRSLATSLSRGPTNPVGGRRSAARPIEVLGVVTDFTRPIDLHDILAERPAMPPVFFYPGSSIGNFTRDEARDFLSSLREHIEAHPADDGKLLIGIDLVKDRATLEAAYDDALGVTAAFNRNVLRVANRLLDAEFDLTSFAHRAVFDEESGRIEMRLVSSKDQTVRIGASSVDFQEGEAIVTEYSHKYTIDGFAALLESAGFAGGERLRCWRDDRGWFGVFVAEPA
jgi:dimethylhistidine N-methyltransferase